MVKIHSNPIEAIEFPWSSQISSNISSFPRVSWFHDIMTHRCPFQHVHTNISHGCVPRSPKIPRLSLRLRQEGRWSFIPGAELLLTVGEGRAELPRLFVVGGKESRRPGAMGWGWWVEGLRSTIYLEIAISINTGWWFGTFFVFSYIGNSHPNWLICFRGVQTTNQNINQYQPSIIDYLEIISTIRKYHIWGFNSTWWVDVVYHMVDGLMLKMGVYIPYKRGWKTFHMNSAIFLWWFPHIDGLFFWKACETW